MPVHAQPTRTRREFVRDAFCGFSGLALVDLLARQEARADGPLSPKRPHLPAKAKSVVWVFLNGEDAFVNLKRVTDVWEAVPAKAAAR